MNSDCKKLTANEASPLVRVLTAILTIMSLAATGIFVFSGQLAKDGLHVGISLSSMCVIALVFAIYLIEDCPCEHGSNCNHICREHTTP